MPLPDRYVRPDLTQPFDLAAHLALAPRDGTVKGMFFSRIIDETRARASKPFDARGHFPFSSYPLADWLTLLYNAARAAYPTEPVRSGLRRLGRSMYPTFAESMIGKVVFSIAGNSVMRALPLYPKIWSVISNHGTAEIDELTPGRVVIRLRNVWDYLDSFQFGSLEGGMGFFGIAASVKIASLGPCDADFEITWIS